MPKIEQKIQVISKDAPVTIIQNNTIFTDPKEAIKANMPELKQKMVEILEALEKPKFDSCVTLMREAALELCDYSPTRLAEWAGMKYITARCQKRYITGKG